MPTAAVFAFDLHRSAQDRAGGWDAYGSVPARWGLLVGAEHVVVLEGVTDDTMRKWRRRFCQHGLDGLRDLPRTGAASTIWARSTSRCSPLARRARANSTAVAHRAGLSDRGSTQA